MVNIYSLTYLIYFAYTHYFFLLFICVLQIGKIFNEDQLSVDVHHPLAEGVSNHINSPGISHLFSQLISDGEYFYLTYVVYAHY